jgi:hypothetical protein
VRHGLAYIYGAPPTSLRFDELVDHFAQDGITLENPSTGEVIRVSPVGEPIPTSREDIRLECVAANMVRFNFYIGPSTNIFCAIEEIKPKVVRETFDLSGKTQQESLRAIRSLAQLFAKRTEKGLSFGFVADRYAELHQRFSLGRFFHLGRSGSHRNGPSSGDVPKIFTSWLA